MSFKDFSNVQYVKTIDDGEIIKIGSFKVQNSLELAFMRVMIIFSNYPVTNETAKLNIHSAESVDSETILFSSQDAQLSLISGLANNWIGFLTFTFDRQPITSARTYYPTFEVSNYNRVDDSYIGLSADFPFPIYDNSEPIVTDHPLAMSIFGYES